MRILKEHWYGGTGRDIPVDLIHRRCTLYRITAPKLHGKCPDFSTSWYHHASHHSITCPCASSLMLWRNQEYSVLSRPQRSTLFSKIQSSNSRRPQPQLPQSPSHLFSTNRPVAYPCQTSLNLPNLFANIVTRRKTDRADQHHHTRTHDPCKQRRTDPQIFDASPPCLFLIPSIARR